MHSTKLFKLLSDDTRLRVTFLLSQDELCVCQIAGITGIAQPKISKAISKLKDLDLVIDRREDKFIYYQLNKEHSLLEVILQDLYHHLHEHQQLKDDYENIQRKTEYLSNCNGIVTIG